MKKLSIILIFCLISIISCATVKNSSGYLITNKPLIGLDGKKVKGFKQTYCNDEKAVAWYTVDGFKNLYSVIVSVRGDYEYYGVIINDKFVNIKIDDIMPYEVGNAEALKIAQKAGFNSYLEYEKNFREQQALALEEKKRQEEERRLEIIRLRREIDNKFGVFAVGSLLHIKNGEVKVGQIIRLGDTFSYNVNDWKRLSSGAFVFGDYDEFEIRGLDMRQVSVNEIKPDRSGYFVDGGRISAGGKRGYIVKYLGTEDVITQAGLRKVIWVCECIGGNIYAE